MNPVYQSVSIQMGKAMVCTVNFVAYVSSTNHNSSVLVINAGYCIVS